MLKKIQILWLLLTIDYLAIFWVKFKPTPPLTCSVSYLIQTTCSAVKAVTLRMGPLPCNVILFNQHELLWNLTWACWHFVSVWHKHYWKASDLLASRCPSECWLVTNCIPKLVRDHWGINLRLKQQICAHEAHGHLCKRVWLNRELVVAQHICIRPKKTVTKGCILSSGCNYNKWAQKGRYMQRDIWQTCCCPYGYYHLMAAYQLAIVIQHPISVSSIPAG